MTQKSTSKTGPASNASLERHCLVTVGATANFTTLLEEAVKPAFVTFLRDRGYTHMQLQCGKQLAQFEQVINSLSVANFQIIPFAFVDDLGAEKMVLCRGEAGRRRDGIIISHAGTGTVLDAMRVGAPIVVVANPTLKDNHQEELAEELQQQGYAIWGKLNNLKFAVEQSELLQEENAHRWRAHPISDGKSVTANLWEVSSALATRYRPDEQQLDASQGDGGLRREEATRMSLD